MLAVLPLRIGAVLKAYWSNGSVYTTVDDDTPVEAFTLLVPGPLTLQERSDGSWAITHYDITESTPYVVYVSVDFGQTWAEE